MREIKFNQYVLDLLCDSHLVPLSPSLNYTQEQGRPLQGIERTILQRQASKYAVQSLGSARTSIHFISHQFQH